MYKLAHVFHAYTTLDRLYVVFFCIIFAVLIKYRDVNNRYYHCINDFYWHYSQFTLWVYHLTEYGSCHRVLIHQFEKFPILKYLLIQPECLSSLLGNWRCMYPNSYWWAQTLQLKYYVDTITLYLVKANFSSVHYVPLWPVNKIHSCHRELMLNVPNFMFIDLIL